MQIVQGTIPGLDSKEFRVDSLGLVVSFSAPPGHPLSLHVDHVFPALYGGHTKKHNLEILASAANHVKSCK